MGGVNILQSDELFEVPYNAAGPRRTVAASALFLRRLPPLTLSGRLHFLDSLRGLAALAVVLFHFYAPGVSPIHGILAGSSPAWVDWVLQHLYCGVDLFFVLSGFVIAFSMDGNAPNVRYAGNFILRRSVRLDPPYWTAAALMLVYYVCLNPANWHDVYLQFSGARGVFANLFYVQNFSSIYPTASILDVSWTLCLEVQFYLAYLLILMLAYYAGRLIVSKSRARSGATLGRGMIFLAVGVIAVWSLAHWVRYRGDGFAGRSWMFFVGVSLYAAITRGVAPAVVILPLAALSWLFAVRQDIEGQTAVATIAAIYTAAVTASLGTWLANRPLMHLGRISYSIYLFHMVIGMNLLDHLRPYLHRHPSRGAWTAWGAWATAVALSLLGAEFLHRVVEAPSNRLSRRLKPGRSVSAIGS
jgi:peptidoglycan/LPS O-acetylase OafA/YrhL